MIKFHYFNEAGCGCGVELKTFLDHAKYAIEIGILLIRMMAS